MALFPRFPFAPCKVCKKPKTPEEFYAARLICKPCYLEEKRTRRLLRQIRRREPTVCKTCGQEKPGSDFVYGHHTCLACEAERAAEKRKSAT